MQQLETLIESDQGIDLASSKISLPQLLHILPQGLGSLYRRAYRLLQNEADAEDAVQDALLAAFKHLNQFRGEAQLYTWLTTIVINCARMQLRKRPRYTHLSLDSKIGEHEEYPLADMLMDGRPNPEDECHRSTLNASLMKSAAQLSPALRKTFQLRFLDHLSICETARVLGVPTGTVKARTARARAKLLQAMRGALHHGPEQRKSCSPRRPHQNNPGASAIKP
jgi:RNA polymerase sigma-70 factor (ECF subfamily)